MVQDNEGVIYRKNFKITPFRKGIEKLLALEQKYKEEKELFDAGVSKINYEQFIKSSNTKRQTLHVIVNQNNG